MISCSPDLHVIISEAHVSVQPVVAHEVSFLIDCCQKKIGRVNPNDILTRIKRCW